MNRITRGVIVFGLGHLCIAAAQAQAPAKRPSQDQPLIASIKGPELFAEYCASCHGKDAKGNGPAAASLQTKPSDLTRIASRNHGVFDLARVQKIIAGEEVLPKGHGSREMPVWGPIFSKVTHDVDLGRVRIDNLARFLRDLQVVNGGKK